MQQPLDALAHEIADLLSRRQLKIVFAESCTGGLISATLCRVPGASNVHCGSAVVYRLDTKTRWLGVSESILADPGPVSEPVARQMAEGVLQITPEADLSAAITGHLGPNAPEAQDGLVIIAIAQRNETTEVSEHRLPKLDALQKPRQFPGTTERELRQWMSVELVLGKIATTLRSMT